MKISESAILCLALSGASVRAFAPSKNNLRGAKMVGEGAKDKEGHGNERIMVGDSPQNPAIPYDQNGCVLGAPLELGVGCRSGNPIDLTSVTDCVSGSSSTAPCYGTGTGGIGQVYTSTIKSTTEESTLVDSVSTAEGSYCGFSASMSASYMSDSTVSSTSYSFILGQSQVLYMTQLENYVNLKLTDNALEDLKTDPEFFLEMYGSHFVYSIGYGASFMGSTELYATESSSSETLDAFASFSASDIYYSESASESFTETVNQTGSYLEVVSNAVWQGTGQTNPFNASNPYDMGEFFTSTWNTVSDDTAIAMTMNYVDWISIQQVSDYIVSTGNQTLVDMFSPTPITSTTSNALNDELVQSQNLLNTVDMTQNWPCYTTNPYSSFASSIDSLKANLTSHVETLEQMSEQEMLEIQTQMTNGDDSFFTFYYLNGDYLQIINDNPDCLPICPSGLWSPPAQDTSCGNEGPTTYSCSNNQYGMAPMEAISFTHKCGDNGAYQEDIAIQCLDTSVLKNPPVSYGETYTTPYVANTGCSGDSTSHTCPTGYYATKIMFEHQCGDNGSDQRSAALECVKPNANEGYALTGLPYSTNWVQKSNCGSYKTDYSCNPGEAILGIDFTHKCGDNGGYQESVSIRCQPLTGKALYCSS